jgi:hypothetical protein
LRLQPYSGRHSPVTSLPQIPLASRMPFRIRDLLPAHLFGRQFDYRPIPPPAGRELRCRPSVDRSFQQYLSGGKLIRVFVILFADGLLLRLATERSHLPEIRMCDANNLSECKPDASILDNIYRVTTQQIQDRWLSHFCTASITATGSKMGPSV